MAKLMQTAPAFGRFLLVGLSGTIVNLGVLWLLATGGVHHTIAAVIATEISIINNFFWNDSWTFRAMRRESQSLFARFIRFQLVASVTALLTLALFLIFTNNFHLYYLLAQFFAIGVATVINFVVNSRLTWNLINKSQQAIPTLELPYANLSVAEEVEE